MAVDQCQAGAATPSLMVTRSALAPPAGGCQKTVAATAGRDGAGGVTPVGSSTTFPLRTTPMMVPLVLARQRFRRETVAGKMMSRGRREGEGREGRRFHPFHGKPGPPVPTADHRRGSTAPVRQRPPAATESVPVTTNTMNYSTKTKQDVDFSVAPTAGPVSGNAEAYLSEIVEQETATRCLRACSSYRQANPFHTR
ncbi:unnamed protein product [Ectocarpus sp. 12 AP-2014]